MRAILSAPLALLLVTAAAHAIDIGVPADQATIQQAIVAARDGDRVLVAPGRYMEHLVFTQAAQARLTSNLIAGNEAIIAGGVYVTAASRDAHPVLTDNTLADNTGQEFQVQADGLVDVANNIFRTSRSGLVASCEGMHNIPVVFTDNLLFATNGAPLGDGCTMAGTLLTVDPLFVGGGGGRAYALQPGSPAIDAGDDSALQPGDRKDVLGAPRIRGGAVDLGALEASED